MEKMRPFRANLIPSIADVFFVTILFCLFFSSKSTLLADCDTGYHIRAGEYIIRTLSVPKFDIFSFHSPAIPWTAHEWLAEVIMAAIHSMCGLTGIVAFFAVLLALTAYLLFNMLESYQTDILFSTAIGMLVLTASQIHWLARPHIFSFLLMITFQYLLESWRLGRRNQLYLLPWLMLLWVNLHGGFLGGFLLLGAYLIGKLATLAGTPAGQRGASYREVKLLAATILACLAASLCNPQGYHILLFPFKLVSNSFLMDHICEFLSPDFHHWMPFKYLLLVLFTIFALSKKSIEVTELLLILIFTNMALYSSRYIPLFALVTAPILTCRADEVGPLLGVKVAGFLQKRSAKVKAIHVQTTGYLWPAVAVVVIAGACYSGRFPHQFDARIKAVAAGEFLMRERITGNMFNDDEIGDYLIYRDYPAYKVFFDGRSDMYGTDILKKYYKIINFEPGWEALLNQYGISWIIFDSDSKFSRYLLKESNWKLIYSDRVASIFVKKLPKYRLLIEKYRNAVPYSRGEE